MWSRPLRPRWRAVIGAALLLPLLPVPGPERALTTAVAQAPPAAKIDEFLVVDCLLPGQVRRLGSKMTILTARRAMKTSQRDCEIRGGEYVAFDRANYATALKVWLPLAEGGDTAAQTYVGEIYEKGLGVPPDHGVAAQWYRKASDAGFARAAINLGYLYERGLGVPRDQTAALNLYRKAAGQSPVTFQITPSEETAAEVQRLRSEIADLRRQLQAREQEADRAQRELDTARRSLEQRRTEADAERAELARLRQALAESRGKEQTAAAGQQGLERAVAEREARIAERERELERSRVEAERQRADADRERAELARLRRELDDLRTKERTATTRVRDLERAVTDREARLADRERETADRARIEAERQRADAERDRAELVRLRQELDAVRARERTATGGQRDLERAVAEREAKIGAREREIGELRTTIGKIESESAARRTTLEKEAVTLRASLTKLEGEMAAARRDASRPAPPPVAKAPDASPIIELIEPELVATRDPGIQSAHVAAASNNVVVVGRVQSAGGIKSFTVNGKEEAVDSRNLFKAQVAMRGSEERVRIVAVDGAGRKSTLDFFLVDPGARRAVAGGDEAVRIGHTRTGAVNFGNYHALVIGINDYRLMRPLRTAVQDAREIGRVLSSEYGFKTTVLVNASRYDILSALNTLRERLTERDNLLIYYAGHGQLDQLNQRGHWLPVDAEPDSSANWISNIAITDVLNAMTTRQLLVVSDSCYSGALTRSAIGQLEPGMTEQQLAHVMMSMAQKRSRMVLTSGGLEPVLDGGGGVHSLFARTFLDLLKSNQGVLPGQELFRHLRVRVAAQAERAQVSQVPEYAPIKYAGHESGDFFFVRTN